MVVFMLIFSYKQNRQMQETFMDNRRKIRGCQFQSAGYACRNPCGAVFANEKIEREKFGEKQ